MQTTSRYASRTSASLGEGDSFIALRFGTYAQERILAAIQADPEITQKELAQSICITLDGIKYYIKNMTKQGQIKHEGSTKAGKWIIVK